MENTKERIQELELRLSRLHLSWRCITAANRSEEDWAEEEALDKELTAKLKQLALVRKAELKSEQTELKGKYPKFSNRLKYIFKVPAEVRDAEERYNEINRELRHLDYLLK